MPGAGTAPRRRRARSVGAGLGAAALAAVLTVAVLDLPRRSAGLSQAVAEGMPGTGVDHEVTAVLLDFRVYDTWLEVAVVLAAVVGTLALARAPDASAREPAPAPPLLGWMTAMVVPVAALVGGYLLWRGTSAPGGAFQAGSVIGAAAVLAWLSGRRSVDVLRGLALRAPVVAAFAGMAAVAAGALAAGRALLDLPEAWSGALIVAMEALVTVSVAVSLPLLFLAARPGARGAG